MLGWRVLNSGAAFGKPLLVLRDLDHDAECPAALVSKLLPRRNDGLLLRIAVREVEVWLLADQAAYANHCGVVDVRSVANPESIADPKRAILALAEAEPASKLSRHLHAGRLRGVPDWALLGEWHSGFAERAWDPKRAAAGGSAPSLARALLRLSEAVTASRVSS